MKQHLLSFALAVAQLMFWTVLAPGQVAQQVSSTCFT